jgi:hypothetical protein
MAEFRWKRGEADFAVRVDIETLGGVFQKGVVVEPGCRALLIVDGAYAGTLDPGAYTEGGLLARLRHLDLTRSATAILVDVGEIELRFTFPNLVTQDPIPIEVDCTLVVQVDDPLLFLTNVMKGRPSLAREEIVRRFGAEIQNALQEAIGRRTVEELNTDLALKQQFELAVGEHLRRTFSRGGFGFVQFRTVAYRYPGFDRVRGIRQDAYLQVSEHEARLAGRKRLFDVYDREQLQAIVEETRKLERQVAQQRERTRVIRELSPLLADEAKGVEQLEKLRLELDKGKLLREEELADFRRTLEESREDAVTARTFLVRRVELEREIEYERMRLVGRADVRLQVLEAEAKARRAQLDVELAEDRERRAHARAQVLEDAQAGRRTQEQQIEVYQRWKEAKLALKEKGDRERRARKLWTHAEKLRLDLERQRDQVEIEQVAADRVQQRQLEMLRALAEASAEAVLTVAGPEQARLIAELRQLDAVKGLSEEQVLAWAASKNPQLVSAFEKKFEKMGRDDLDLFYTRWLADKDRAREELLRILQGFLETQRDVSVAASGAHRPTIVTGAGAGSAVVVGGGLAGEGFFRCTQCGATLQADAKFCHRCGRPVSGGPMPAAEAPG